MKSAAENKIFYSNRALNIRGRLLTFDNPKIMGILNVTPDSFYDGGLYDSEKAILSQTEKMLKDGATFIDVGGYSSRPGAKDISADEETRRVIKAISLIVKNFPEAIISIDTFRSDVANASVQEGAALINDISGGELDQAMFEMVSKLKVPYILMHMRGNPRTMGELSYYDNIVKNVTDYFHSKIEQLNQLGVKDVIIDPGFGFAKTIEQNFKLLQEIGYFKILGKPILAGLSRKSMIWKTLSITPDLSLNGTTCLNTIALLKGVNILRVHDVREAAEICQLVSLMSASNNDTRF